MAERFRLSNSSPGFLVIGVLLGSSPGHDTCSLSKTLLSLWSVTAAEGCILPQGAEKIKECYWPNDQVANVKCTDT